ncbi:MAG: aminotransferase class I/II-fold pyridoxal phosphate-dependent enzyme [Lachnospiraceae bacterium]|nr:aminotransferase class I/II-fold pyridoxal phosphate-dependent enzyme [Lachnospiraceae bacterium]
MSTPYVEMSKEQLEKEYSIIKEEYNNYKSKNLSLDMSRGKPSPDQLDLSLPMMDILTGTSDYQTDIDCRNYGGPQGIKEAKKLMADMMSVDPDNIIIFGNSSLNVMYDIVATAFVKGIMGNTPWSKLDKVKFLCPVPGYDRHFAITEYFGVEMISIPMTEDGPDMDLVAEYVNNDESVKGMWCVPMYSNPLGTTYSDETVRKIAALKPAAKDFRIIWDNAYCVHHIYEDKQDSLLDIFAECDKCGNSDMVYMLASTSKITFPGSGISALATSANNIKDVMSRVTWQTIGHDKINQLRHVRFLKDLDGIRIHMAKHADLIRPKFELVLDILDKELGDLNIGTWKKPNGGYFISFDSMDGCAKSIVSKAKEAGVVMTGAGATYPYHNDPKDSNIRIAPTYPSLEELSIAAKLFTVCVKLVSLEKLLNI